MTLSVTDFSFFLKALFSYGSRKNHNNLKEYISFKTYWVWGKYCKLSGAYVSSPDIRGVGTLSMLDCLLVVSAVGGSHHAFSEQGLCMNIAPRSLWLFLLLNHTSTLTEAADLLTLSHIFQLVPPERSITCTLMRATWAFNNELKEEEKG